ncbi:MAG: hypothetical protein WCT01_01650 [Candidatus Shapirobacteria bacterium]|jgi:hypothetical protein
MEIVNLASPNSSPNTSSFNNHKPSVSTKLPIIIIAVLAIFSGFILSRLTPSSNTATNLSDSESSASPVSVTDPADLKPGVFYGNNSKDFTDTATGIIESGSVNGEGTHILIRDGGDSQKASLTSSVLDLDLFVDKKVEVRGQTNSSNKANWLMDVGSIKILQ